LRYEGCRKLSPDFRLNRVPPLLLVALCNVFHRVEKSILTEQPVRCLAALGLDVVQNLCNNQAYVFFLQHPVKLAQGLRRQVVYIVDRVGVEVEPSQ
jgi:hypothetical protein